MTHTIEKYRDVGNFSRVTYVIRAAKWYGTSVFSTEFQVKIREYGNGADSTEIRNLGKKTSVVCIASELDAQLHLYHHLYVSQFKWIYS